MDILENLDPNLKLQRYVDFAKFVDFIDTKKLFLSRVSCFEDGFEGALTHSFAIITSGQANLLAQALCSWPSANELTQEETREQKAYQDRLTSEYENLTYSTVFGSYSRDEIEHETVYKQHRHWVDVSCWHANETESMAMWKIYGGSTNAVCIVTDVGRLSKAVQPNNKHKFVLSKVHYISYEDSNFIEEHKLAPLLHKSQFYSFENEVRLLAYDPTVDLRDNRDDMSRGTSVNINLDCLIQEIRVAHDAPDWFFKLVCNVTNKYSINAPVIRSEMSKPAFFGFS
ncbi:DUF2971 domain-containing protein [Vibrio rotiferianus]|uniref:DUF2971 domain-containing protein n=1 Tax=Vibrio TaxID=662 RepID=UPI0013893D51|nr:DUF2971 domain-containing protein [Vibrio sp. LB10LO1]NDJ83934.1 DUF2971 domain-containing protein [Vibrio sp. LB10LO1]